MNTAGRVIVIPPKAKTEQEQLRQRQLRVAAYCRVSTDSEDQLHSYAAQKRYFTDRIMTNPRWSMVDVFADEGLSGTQSKNRTEFLRMIRLCRQKKIDMVLIKSFSRFARNTLDSLDYIRTLRALGIAIFFEKENINTLEVSSELIITMHSAFAQAESESISENVRWGKRRAMKEGKVSFQYKWLYGFERGEDGLPKVIPDQAETVRRIANRYLAGDSVPAIKAMLEADKVPSINGRAEWSISCIQNILRNEKYCGDVLMQKTYTRDCISKQVIKNTGQLPMYLIKDHHDAILSRETYQALQAEIARRTGRRSATTKNCTSGLARYSSKYALTERVVCGECGTLYKRCTWTQKGEKRIVWRCVSRLEYGKKYCKHSATVDEEPLKQGIMTAINALMSDKAVLIAGIIDAMGMEECRIPSETMSSADIDHQIKDLNADMQKLLACAASDGDGFAPYAERFKALADEVAMLKVKKAQLQRGQEHDEHAARRLTEAAKVLEQTSPQVVVWDESTIRQLVETVTVLSCNKIRVCLRGGAEVEQELMK